jgi:plastocyanin
MLIVATPSHASEHVVTANPDLTFTPSRLIVIEGDVVRFRNGGGTHNVHADDDRFVCSIDCTTNTGPSGAEWSSLVTFGRAGTIGYYCDKHGGTGGGMRGTIVVVTERIFGDGFDAPSS